MSLPPVKRIHIFGGGTVADITSHFAVCAPAFGSTARELMCLVSGDERFDKMEPQYELTQMAGGTLRTNADVAARIEQLKAEVATKVVFMSAALCDWEPALAQVYPIDGNHRTSAAIVTAFGKHAQRLETRQARAIDLNLTQPPSSSPPSAPAARTSSSSASRPPAAPRGRPCSRRVSVSAKRGAATSSS